MGWLLYGGGFCWGVARWWGISKVRGTSAGKRCDKKFLFFELHFSLRKVPFSVITFPTFFTVSMKAVI